MKFTKTTKRTAAGLLLLLGSGSAMAECGDIQIADIQPCIQLDPDLP